MFWKARCSVSSGMVEEAACLWISPDWVLSRSPVDLDHVGGGRVERGDLLEHQLLVGQRLGDGDRGAQRRDGGGRGAVDALHQLDIVLLDQVEREIALHGHRHLGEQVGGALAGVEQARSRGSPWPWPARSRRARSPSPRAWRRASWRCGSSARACPSSSTCWRARCRSRHCPCSSSSLPEASAARIAAMWVCADWYFMK